MSVKVNDDGVVKIVCTTWRKPRDVIGLENSNMIIQHKDFAYDPETRGLKIIDTDTEDREAYIQSFADDCGVYNVLKKYSKTGDFSLLNVGEPVYGDISELPVDNLDPAGAAAAASEALASLNNLLGSELTSDQLENMSAQEITDLINRAVAAQQQQQEPKEGE